MSKTNLALLLTVLGVVALIVGINIGRKQKSYLPVQAEITRIETDHAAGSDDTEHRVTVRYTVDGKTYEELFGYYQDSYEEGKVIDILYNPADPTQTVQANRGMTVYLKILGPVLILFGGFTFIRRRV